MKIGNQQSAGLPFAAKTLTAGLLLMTGISSCQVINKYRSPETDTAGWYRDADGDTTTVASIPWRSYFTDSDLQKLIAEGLQANFDLRTAQWRIQEAEAGLLVARSAYFPTAALSGQVTHTRTDALGHGSTQYSLGIPMQWEVDLWGKLKRQARAQYAQYRNSVEYRRLIQTSLVSTVSTSYYTLLALAEQLRISRETVGLLEESTLSMQAMMDAGMLNAAAVEQSSALQLSTQVSALNLEVLIRKLENSLSVVLGRRPGPIERRPFADWTAPSTPLPHGVPAQMLALRPDVQSAEWQLRAAFELRHAAQAALYPTLTLSAGTMAGYSAASLTDFFRVDNLLANLIGGLTQPLFAGNRLRAQVAISRAQEEEALLNFQKTALTAAREVSDVLFTYEKALEKTACRAAQTEALRKAVYYTQELLRAGEATYIEVLTAQQNYLNAQLSTVGDNLEKAQAVIDLYRALGGGGD